MIKLVVLTGVRGAGKTTVAKAVSTMGVAKMLKPFTTRQPRDAQDQEYHFKSRRPAASSLAWDIQVGSDHYGMELSELRKISATEVAITVFEPTNISILQQYRQQNIDVEVVIVGLDTIATEAEQASRVGGSTSRLQTQAQIDSIRSILNQQDINIHGNEQEIIDAVSSICRILSSRGGIIPKQQLEPLLSAGCLLKNANPANLQSASYDLRVGNEIWCAGAFKDLNAQDPLFNIPPYSYAIIKAEEVAVIPPFMIAQFDLKVSHFLSGVILSNGPQVDPGYRGDLFCMLFNGSSVPRALRQGDHFSTIHFMTTTKGGEPYAGQYSLRDKLRNTMPPEAALGPGGAIFERITAEIDAAKREVIAKIPAERSGIYLGIIAIIAALCLPLAMWAGAAALDANKAAEAAREAVQKLSETKNSAPMVSQTRDASEEISTPSATSKNLQPAKAK